MHPLTPTHCFHSFDPEWATNGLLDEAVVLLSNWVKEQNVPGLTLEVHAQLSSHLATTTTLSTTTTILLTTTTSATPAANTAALPEVVNVMHKNFLPFSRLFVLRAVHL
jgi:hypothetical protein